MRPNKKKSESVPRQNGFAFLRHNLIRLSCQNNARTAFLLFTPADRPFLFPAIKHKQSRTHSAAEGKYANSLRTINPQKHIYISHFCIRSLTLSLLAGRLTSQHTHTHPKKCVVKQTKAYRPCNKAPVWRRRRRHVHNAADGSASLTHERHTNTYSRTGGRTDGRRVWTAGGLRPRESQWWCTSSSHPRRLWDSIHASLRWSHQNSTTASGGNVVEYSVAFRTSHSLIWECATRDRCRIASRKSCAMTDQIILLCTVNDGKKCVFSLARSRSSLTTFCCGHRHSIGGQCPDSTALKRRNAKRNARTHIQLSFFRRNKFKSIKICISINLAATTHPFHVSSREASSLHLLHYRTNMDGWRYANG